MCSLIHTHDRHTPLVLPPKKGHFVIPYTKIELPQYTLGYIEPNRRGGRGRGVYKDNGKRSRFTLFGRAHLGRVPLCLPTLQHFAIASRPAQYVSQESFGLPSPNLSEMEPRSRWASSMHCNTLSASPPLKKKQPDIYMQKTSIFYFPSRKR